MKGFIALCLVLLAAGCASTGGTYEAPAPQWVRERAPRWVRERPPRGAIWGIGAARSALGVAALPLARNRGRMGIARQLDALVRETLRGYAAGQGGETLDGLAERTGRRIIAMNIPHVLPLTVWNGPDGRWWCRMTLRTEEARAVIMEVLDAETAEIPGFDRAAFQSLLTRRLARRASRPPVIDS